MADNEKDFDDFDLDSDLDLPEFDDSDLDMKKDDRTPIARAAGGFMKGAKESMLTRNTQRTLIRNTLPEGYAKTHDDINEGIDTARDLYDTVSEQLAPAKKQVKSLGRGLAKKSKGVLPKWMTDKLEEWSQPDEDYTSGLPTQADHDSNEIATTLAGIFETQQRSEAKDKSREERRKDIEEELEDARFKTSARFLGNIESGISRLVSYQDNVTARIQRKSLELQFRQYFVARDQYALFQGYSKDVAEQLEQISHNTALPEFVKLRKSERVKEMMRDRILGKVEEGLSGFASRFAGNLTGSVKNKLSSGAMSARDFIQQAADAQEMAGDAEDVDKVEIGGEIAGGLGAEFLASESNNLLGKLGRSRAGKALGADKLIRGLNSDRVKRVGADLGYVSDNKREVFEDYIREQREKADDAMFDDSGIKNLLKSAVFTSIEEGLPRYNPQATFGRETTTIGQEHAVYTELTDRTIVEIIPNLLSSILRETESIRTGDGNVERMMYSHDQGGLVRESSLNRDIIERIFPESSIESMRENVGDIVDMVDPDKKLSDDARSAFMRQLMMDISSDRSFNVVRYTKPGSLDHIEDDAQQEEVRSVIMDKFLDQDSGKLKKELGTRETRAEASRLYSRSKGLMPDYNQTIAELTNVYGKDALQQAGMIQATDNRGRFITDLDNVTKHITEGETGKGARRAIQRRVQNTGQVDLDPQGVFGGEDIPTPEMAEQSEQNRLSESLINKVDTSNIYLKNIWNLLDDRLPPNDGGPSDSGPSTPNSPQQGGSGGWSLPASSGWNKSVDLQFSQPNQPSARRWQNMVPSHASAMDMGGGIKDRFSAGRNRLSNVAGELKGKLSGWGDDLRGQFGDARETITKRLNTLITELKGVDLSEHLNQMRESLNGRTSSAQQYLSDKYGHISKVTPDMVETLKSDLASRWEQLSENERELWERLNTKGSAAKGKMSQFGIDGKGSLDSTVSRAKSGLDNVKSDSSEKWGSLKDDLSDIDLNSHLRDMGQSLQQNRSKAQSYLIEKYGEIQDDSSEHYQKLKKDLTTRWDDLTIEEKELWSKVTEAKDQLNDKGKNWKQTLQSNVGQARSRLEEGSSSAKDRIQSWLGQLSESIQGTFSRGDGGGSHPPGDNVSQEENEPLNWLEDIKRHMDEKTQQLIEAIMVSGVTGEDPEAKQGIMKRFGKGLLDTTGNFFKGTMNLWSGTLSGSGNLLRGGGRAAGNLLGKMFGRGKDKDQIFDIYRKGEEEPVLRARELKRNTFLDMETQEPVRTLKDITGPVVDIGGNIVITQEDIDEDRLIVYEDGQQRSALDFFGNMIGGAGRGLGKLTGVYYSGLWGAAKSGLGLAKRSVKWALGMGPKDIYVEGETTPRMRAVLMKRDYYFDQATQEPIKGLKDIKGPVINREGNVVISEEDIEIGLVDSTGSPVGKLIKGAIGLAKGAAKLTGKYYKGLWGAVKGGASRLLGRGKRGKGNGSAGEDGDSSEIDQQQLTVLEEIRDLIKSKLSGGKKVTGDTDGDGYRDNSWRSKFFGNKKKKDDDDEGNKGKFADKGDSLLAKLTGGIGGLLGGLFGGDGGVNIGGGTDLLTGGKDKANKPDKTKKPKGGKKGLLGKLWGGVKKYGGKALGAVGTAAAFAGPLLLKGAMALGSAIGSVVSAPVLLAGAAVAAVGIGGYFLYKHLTKKDQTPINKVRFAQYGIDLDEKEWIQKAAALEDVLFDEVQFREGSEPTISSNVDSEKLREAMGIAKDDEDQVEVFLNWLQARFKPVFLSHMMVANKLSPGTKLIELDEKLDASLAIEQLKKTRFGDAPAEQIYSFEESPFEEGEDLEGKGYVDDMYEEAMETLQDKKSDEKENKATSPSVPGNKLTQEIQGARKTKSATVTKDKRRSGLNGFNAMAPSAGFHPPKSVTRAKRERIQYYIEAAAQVQPYEGKIPPVTGVRMTAYGLRDMDPDKVGALLGLEKTIKGDVKVSKRGEVDYSGEPTKLYKSWAGAFDLDPDSTDDMFNWISWFKTRFIPVLAKYKFMLDRINQSVGVDTDGRLKGSKARYVAKPITTTLDENNYSIWKNNTSPWKGYLLADDSDLATPYLSLIADDTSDSQSQSKGNDRKKSTSGYGEPSASRPSGGHVVQNVDSSAMEEAKRVQAIQDREERKRRHLSTQQQSIQSQQVQDTHRMVGILNDSVKVQRSMDERLKDISELLHRQAEEKEDLQKDTRRSTPPPKQTTQRNQSVKSDIEAPVSMNR